MLLDYKILKNDSMTATGSQILRAIQNNDLPKLDLLTREVIQNSLDARNGIDKKVGVRVNTGCFDIDNFAKILGSIGESIERTYPKEKYNTFISFSDIYTTGLTGPLLMSNVNQNDYGKYLNLIFNIGRAQSDIHAGGSWGYGKTVFYRMGIGLVIFYTRIFEDNQYKSRLVISFIQNDKETIIPSIEENSNLKTGIMWFGKKYNNEILPIEDENEIKQILSFFNLKAYENTDTGTTIIMPYIDKENLLLDTYNDDDREPWCYSIEEYIKVAVQRWYAPRLMNPYYEAYERNPYLELSINEKKFDIFKDFLPMFKTVRDLYNIAIKQDFEDNDKYFKRNISIRKVFENVDEAGKIAFAKLSKNDLKMLPPDNSPSPYAQIKNFDKKEIEPIITFCRKPGMLLKYDINENWSKKINIDPSGDQYIIGLFVANSNNSMKRNKKSFEEYLRSCEKADHTNWTEENNSNILNNIQNNICNKINKTFEDNDIENIKGVNSKLTRELTNIFLPKTGFGFRPNAIKSKSNNIVKGTSKPPIQRSNIISLDNSHWNYLEENIDRDFIIRFSKRDNNINYQFQILSEINNINIDDWKTQFKKVSPIIIVRMDLLYKKDKEDVYYFKNIHLDSNINVYKDRYLELKKIYTNDNKEWIGWNIHLFDNEINEIRIRLTYKILDSKLAYEIVRK